MKDKIILLLFLLIWILLSAGSFSISNDFFPSPRFIAMGNAYVAIADDANAVFLNPAGLGIKTNNDLLVGYGDFLDTKSCVFASKIDLGSFGGLGLGYCNNLWSISFYTTTGLLDEFKQLESDAMISYGYKILENLSLGLSVHNSSREYTLSLHNYFAYGYGLDLGLLVKPVDSLSLGLLIENLSSTDFIYNSGRKEKIAKTVVLGLAYQLNDRLLLALDIRSNNIERNYDADKISIGAEFSLINAIKLRVGCLFDRYSNLENIYIGNESAGISINLGSFQLDYAIRKVDSYAYDVHIGSIGYEF